MRSSLEAFAPLVGASIAQIAELERAVGVPLPTELVEFLELAGSEATVGRFHELEAQTEWAALGPGSHDLMGCDEMIEAATDSSDVRPPAHLGSATPIGYACPGFGGFVWVAWDRNRTCVVEADEQWTAASLHALSLRRFLEGLLLPEVVWRAWPADRLLASTAPRSSVIPSVERVGSAQLLSEFDALLDSTMTDRLPLRASGPQLPTVGLRELLLGHGWGKAIGRGSFEARPWRLQPALLRTRVPLVASLAYAAVFAVASEGYIDDQLGLFGEGIGAEVSGETAVEFVRALSVEGDLDDLSLHVRSTVAVPVSELHS